MTLRKLLLALGAVVGITSSAYAQYDWKPILHPLHTGFTIARPGFRPACYFINENIGFIFDGLPFIADLGRDGRMLYRTTDGGVTWEDFTLDIKTGITSMVFDSIHHGYASVRHTRVQGDLDTLLWNSCGVFETNDTGRTWRKLNPKDGVDFHAIYSCGNRLFGATYLFNQTQEWFWTSEDQGQSWKPLNCKLAVGPQITGNRRGEIFTGGAWKCPNRSEPVWGISYSGDSGRTWEEHDYAFPLIGYSRGSAFWGDAGFIIASATTHDGIKNTRQILISKDKGMSWNVSQEYFLDPSESFEFGSVATSGCAAYVQTYLQGKESGILRSTDFGNTWQNVGGPDNTNIYGISVTSNGSVIYATQAGSDTLWKTTTGGDGTITSTPRPEEFWLQKTLLSSTSLKVQSPDTLFVQLCDSGKVELQFLHSGPCMSARLQNLRLDEIPKDNYNSKTYIRSYADGLIDSAYAVIYPTAAGVYPVTLRATYEFSALERRDTLLHFILVVRPNPSILEISARDTITFKKQRLCNALTDLDSISLRAVGCDPLTVKSIRFEDVSVNSGFGFKDAMDVVLVPTTTPKSFQITFKPKRAGDFLGRLIIEGPDGADTILVIASAEEGDRTMVISGDTLKAALCESTEGTFEITNTSCRLVTIDSLNIPAPLELLPGQLPIGIQAGKSIRLKVRFSPTALGPQSINAQAHLRFVGQNETIAFDTSLALACLGLHGKALTVTSDSTIDVGDVSICAEREIQISIRSFGCDSLNISVSLSRTDQGFTIVQQPKTEIGVDQVAIATIVFVPPGVGAFTCDFLVSTNAGNRKVTLTGNGLTGSKALTTSLDSINFGETNICEERDSIVHLTNNGCDTLVITSVDVDKNFNVGGTFPIALAPGESIDVPVTTIVDTVGKPTVLTGNLTITSTADNTIAPITLMRQLHYPTKLRIEAVDEASGKAGDIVKFSIILEGEVPSTMTALHFDFLHNNDLLSFEGNDGVGLSIKNTIGNDNQRQSFTLSPVHGGVLGELSFKTYLASAEQTTLSFDKITFDAKGVTFAPECLAVIADSGSRFNYVYACGDNIIRDRLNGTRLIKSITPNPASTQINIELTRLSDAFQIQILDLTGKEILTAGQQTTLSIADLPTGLYYVRVVSGQQLIETRRIQVVR